MKTKLQLASYDRFRQVINAHCTRQIAQHGDTTLLYDVRNSIIAAMKPAGIDEQGRCRPVSYFVSEV